MNKYLLSLIKFGVIFVVIYLLGLFLPTTPKAKNYYLKSKVTKDSLLLNIPSPRMIFLGGSNVVFGLNSQLVKDSLRVNPINIGLTAPVGLIYMINDLLPKIKKGDVVIVSPEYHHYFNGYAYGNIDLVRLVFDVDFNVIKSLDKKQWMRLLKRSPSYFISKFDPNEYFGFDKKSVYGKNIFNEYGDSNFHWQLDSRKFKPTEPLKNKFDFSLIKKLIEFNDSVEKKGAVMYITFSCFEEKSFNNNSDRIAKVSEELKKSKLKILGTANRYKFKTSLMFDTPYHLSKKGVDLRTKYLIKDYKSFKNGIK